MIEKVVIELQEDMNLLEFSEKAQKLFQDEKVYVLNNVVVVEVVNSADAELYVATKLEKFNIIVWSWDDYALVDDLINTGHLNLNS